MFMIFEYFTAHLFPDATSRSRCQSSACHEIQEFIETPTLATKAATETRSTKVVHRDGGGMKRIAWGPLSTKSTQASPEATTIGFRPTQPTQPTQADGWSIRQATKGVGTSTST